MSHDRRPGPVPRSRSGFAGRHRERTGTEPATAQSALRVRLLLSVIFLPFICLVTAGFALWWATADAAGSPGPGSLGVLTLGCAVLALLAAADLVVILRRRRRERGPGSRGGGARRAP